MSLFFLLYNIMQVFHYPEDYLSKKGNIKHCWEVHVKKMKEIWQPYVDYVRNFRHFKAFRASLIAQLVKNPPTMQETPVRFLGQEDLLENG